MTEQPLLIKKYGNRRLYDTQQSRYITLEDLSQIVKSGRDVQVVDAKTNKDLTKSVLLQIITESEKERDMIPVSFLKKMIQISDQALGDSLHRYLRVTLDAFLSAQQEFEERYKSFAGTLVNPMAGNNFMANMNPLMWPMSLWGRSNGAENGFGPAGPSEPAPVAPSPGAPVDSPAEPPPKTKEEVPDPQASQADQTAGAEPENSSEGQLKALKEQMAQMQAVLEKLQQDK